MGYSCTDFADDILNTLKIELPDSADDNPSEQADLAMEEIERLYRIENPCGEVLKALKDIRGEIDLIQGYWTEGLDNFAQQADNAIALAAGVPFLPADAVIPLAIDWRAIAVALAGDLSNCMHQIGQMQGMFDDGDGTIQEALDGADETMARFNAASKGDKAPALHLCVVIEGGVVQSVISDDPAMIGRDVAVIDYDTEGADAVDMFGILQDSGKTAMALGHIESIDTARIDLAATFATLTERGRDLRG